MLSVDRIKPNCYTYPSLFKACGSKLESSSVWVKYGRALHTHVVKFIDPVECDEFVFASLISFYSKCGKFDVCKYLFGRVSRRDLGLWNCMFSSCDSMEVLCLFSDMQKDMRIRPNEVSFVALINACGDLGAFSQGVWAHCYMVKNGLKVNRFVVTALIDFY
nr:pentatricopeptide repeat-containing protein At5g43790 [Tanacetum cinerariifolium]